MRTGVRLGIDAGKVRVGVAQSDPHGILATPITTLSRKSDELIPQLVAMISELNAVEVIVGLPVNLGGIRTPSTENAIELAHEIAAATSASVRMIDERLTTVSAHAALRQAGKKQRGTRSVIDQVAAVMVLQHALDSERASGNLPGVALEDL